jgi:hypothetical protein
VKACPIEKQRGASSGALPPKPLEQIATPA